MVYEMYYYYTYLLTKLKLKHDNDVAARTLHCYAIA